jgi:hypothetical protein
MVVIDRGIEGDRPRSTGERRENEWIQGDESERMQMLG